MLRDNCNNFRDRAMIDFLLSTGIRVDELVRLNIDAKTKIHLLNYIESRADDNKALFVSLNKLKL